MNSVPVRVWARLWYGYDRASYECVGTRSGILTPQGAILSRVCIDPVATFLVTLTLPRSRHSFFSSAS